MCLGSWTYVALGMGVDSISSGSEKGMGEGEGEGKGEEEDEDGVCIRLFVLDGKRFCSVNDLILSFSLIVQSILPL